MPHRPIPQLTAAQIRRFWNKADRVAPSVCWNWHGTTKDGRGYHRPVVSLGPAANRFYYGASRVSYYIHTGVDPAEKEVCHSCDNPLCVNPHHLWLGTQADNVADAVAKGRHKPGRFGHGEASPSSKLTEVAVRAIRKARGRQRDIARMFGVSQANVSAITTLKTWAHVT